MTAAPPPGSAVSALTDYERLLRLEELVETIITRIDELESKMDDMFESLQLEIAQDRKRITALEQKFSGPLPNTELRDHRKETLMAILLANGGKMLQKELGARMGLDKAEISRLVKSLEKEGLVRSKSSGSNKRMKVIYVPSC